MTKKTFQAVKMKIKIMPFEMKKGKHVKRLTAHGKLV
jgi:hypothetical protein